MKMAVGIILIFMSIVHVIYGEKMQVDVLKKLKADNILIGSFRAMSLQGGILLFAVGVIEILVFTEVVVLTGFAIYIPVGIICLNVLSVLIVALGKHLELFKATIPQFFIFAIIIILQVMSIN
ncbi:hypothetical protein [Virgibacillus sp. DJP39]|uniref:hypothetical protein n=1 Tax=Virgibacillus sp. DJP39 TaxID=3409790 RepID=UPI003BB6641D